MTEQRIICRLCLATHDNLNFINRIQTDMLQTVFTNMDVNISQFAKICNDCADTLNHMFTFKSIVLGIEDKLQSYTNNGQRHVCLEDILEGREIKQTSKNEIEISRVCRTCLGYIKDNSFTVLNENNYSHLTVLQTCLPEMNIQMTKQPMVCSRCINTLEIMFGFIKFCMNNESKIKYYLKTEPVENASFHNIIQNMQLREPQNGVKLDIVRSEDVIVIDDDDESSAKKYNTRGSMSKNTNTKRNEDETDEVDDNVADDPDYEIDEDSSEYDSDFEKGEIQNVQVSMSKNTNTKRNEDETDDADDNVTDDPDYEIDEDSSEYDSDFEKGEIQNAQVKKGENKDKNEYPVSKGNVQDLLAGVQFCPITSIINPFIYCKYCSFRALDEKTLQLHILHCQNAYLWQNVAMRGSGRKKRKGTSKELHANLTGERDLNITENTGKELPAKKTEKMEPLEEIEDIELVTSEDSVTLTIKRLQITNPKEIGVDRENNESVIPRETNDLILSNKLDKYVTNQSRTSDCQSEGFVEIMILKCLLCGFNTRSLAKVKHHLTSHCFDSYFGQYNIDGYNEIFYCGKCVRSFHDKFSLQDHDCVNESKTNVTQFKVGVMSYCMRCFFETDKEDIFLSHIAQCAGQKLFAELQIS